MEAILAKMKRRFHMYPRYVLKKLYKIRVERLRLYMIHNLPEEVRWIIEAKVRKEEYLPTSHMPGTGRSKYSQKRRAKRIGSKCYKCARWTCEGKCRSIGIPSVNRDDKINFIKDGLSKEILDNFEDSLETHPSGDVRSEMGRLWLDFQQEWRNLGNLISKDPVCQFIRKLDGKPILDP